MIAKKVWILVGIAFLLATAASIFLYFRYAAIKENAIEKRKVEEIASLADSMSRLLRVEHFREKAEANEQVFSSFWRVIQSPDLLRIKAWDENSTIIWSDLKELIGMRVPDEVEIIKALKDEPSFEVTEARTNHLTERRLGEVIELALPFHDENGAVIGVIEIYRSANSLNETIQKEFRALALLVFAVPIVIMAVITFLLFFLRFSA